MPEVLLVHGLWYRNWSMLVLHRRLRKQGMSTAGFGYPSIWRPPGFAIEKLRQRLSSHGHPLPHLVGHSLGGLVIIETLKRHFPDYPARVVLLGSPVNGSAVARKVARWPVARGLLGRAAALLQAGASPAGLSCELGMISGTRGRGVGRLVGAVENPSDGTVACSETRDPAIGQHVQVNVSHTGLLFSRQVSRQVVAFLAQGAFDR